MAASSYSPNNGIRFRKRKARFTFSEVHILLDEVRKNRHIVVGKFNRGVPTGVKKRTWAAITACVNEIGECQREVLDVIKKWYDLKCDTKRKVAAIRAGAVPNRGMKSHLSRELSPIENIVHQILELDGKRGRLPTPDRTVYSGTGRREEDGSDQEEEEDVTLGIPSSSVENSNNGDASHSPFEMQYEITYEDHELQLMDSDEECQPRAPPPPNPTEDERLPASLGHVSASTSRPASSSPSSAAGARRQSQPAPGAQAKMAHCTALSIQEQHDTNILLGTVSRTLEQLSESMQQLAETQQEFVHDSLQLQRETVHILRDFATGALALMHDNLNGRPAL